MTRNFVNTYDFKLLHNHSSEINTKIKLHGKLHCIIVFILFNVLTKNLISKMV